MFAGLPGLSLDRDHDMSSDQVFLGGCLSSDKYYKLKFLNISGTPLAAEFQGKIKWCIKHPLCHLPGRPPSHFTLRVRQF